MTLDQWEALNHLNLGGRKEERKMERRKRATCQY
jgi:hypothetical protein